MILKHTISLCPECLIDIPATIYEENGMAVMRKSCPEHGEFEGVVERDVEFYKLIQKHNAAMFYDGLIVDVTYRCNLRCKWCFQHLGAEDVPKERIYALAAQMPKGHNIVLSGGEPTLRADLGEIVWELKNRGNIINVITNGLNIDWDLPCRWTLSHHPESEDLFNQRIEEAHRDCRVFGSIIYTDNTLDEYYRHIQHAIEHKDICTVFRMHMAAPVGGNLNDHTNGFFTSDMYKYLLDKGHNLEMYPPKTIFVPVLVDCVPFMLISWNNAYNVDIVENHAEPWYHGRGNTVDNLVTRIIRDR